MNKVSRKNLIGAAVLISAISAVGISLWAFKTAREEPRSEKGAAYYCPMHPSYHSDRAGNCPICNMKLVRRSEPASGKGRKVLYYRHPMGQPDVSPVPKKDSMGMDYVPVYENETGAKPSRVAGHAAVYIPLEKQQLIGVKSGRVEKKNLVKTIRTAGRVAYDPELFTAQREFVSAVIALERARKGPYHEPLERTRALVESAGTRLRILGMSEEEIRELEKSEIHDRNLILPEEGSQAPISLATQYVWVYAMIYEYELPFVKAGTRVKVTVPTFPNKLFEGEVKALDPILDTKTRSIKTRVQVANPEGLLKPEMYADVLIESHLGESLALPEEAVLPVGDQAIVFVVRPDGYFEPRNVKLGMKAGNFYEVKEGVGAGEQVVTSANFLIDSESRLQAALAGMTPESPGIEPLSPEAKE